ncbi:MAG TPA: exonuclease domain-containing protein, partial [Bryobacteraceae bacterium]|nr:exonuclease domain-containing protein [Bryobacteraceae bacterium]
MSWDPGTPVEQVRFVVLDSETTGLDPRKDRIVTIGVIAVVNNEILIEDSFEALLKVEYNSSA